ncbi:hypothetical protein Pcinc_029840 [Petrolisthes cinctipes]|uniref:Peptidase S9 prolyl oligopeptidase catalytic domain-containing protein n=1 Tax=Petrolisthes cinctipes TaxID=88211 RepID=A0AAE1K5B4_PETCI|nr:hypothetical protein Pcinc_029840 [Petrolisthes cinctipes]
MGGGVEAKYGSWKSPISSHLVTRSGNKVEEAPQLDIVTGNVFWSESVSTEEGRNAVFCATSGKSEVMRWTPPGYDVRTRVHEYGGGAFTVYNNTVFFSNAIDDALYKQEGPGPDSQPSRLTPPSKKRYADGVYWQLKKALVVVVEDHHQEGREAVTTLTLVDVNTGIHTILAHQGADFFSSPAVSHTSNRLAWIQWCHPEMPWGKTKLCVAEVTTENQVNILFSQQTGSMMTPTFDVNDDLYYIHDQTGWWNLYKLTDNFTKQTNLTPESREVGWPSWLFGWRAYAVNPTSDGKEVVVVSDNELRVVEVSSRKSRVLNTGYTVHSHGVVYSKDGTKVFVLGGDGARSRRVIQVEVATATVKVVSQVPELHVHPGYFSIPQHITFPTSDNQVAHGYLYLPKNPDYHAPVCSKPPLLVRVHGGPTGAATPILNLEYQFFTSRGFAILDVNYRGSTGYGTAYRDTLIEKWGILDIQDVEAGASHLVKKGLVDPERLCIDGWSAGGYTTMAVLTTPGSCFKAGASYYGVSDLEKLATDTHKFESRYMDSMVGELPQHKDRFDARSPLKNCQRLHSPTIFFQGAEDKIVLPSQAREMYEVVKNKGLPTALIMFEGEYHGFVNPDNQRSSLEAEIYFYSQVFGFTLADVSPQVEIENLAAWKSKKKQGALKK